MWYSFGDKHEIIRRECKTGRRRVDATLPVVIALCACFVVTRHFFVSGVDDYRLIQQIVFAASGGIILMMGIIKFLRNDRELDIALILVLVIILIILFIL